MMRVLIPLIVAFVVAAGGATGISVLRAGRTVTIAPDSGVAVHDTTAAVAAPEAPAATTDSVVADSTAKAPAVEPHQPPAPVEPTPSATRRLRRPARAAESNPDTAAADAVSAAAAPRNSGATPGTAAASVPPGTAPASVPPGPAPTSTARLVATPGIFVGGRISKIFAAMPAKEAAKILDQMVDADVVLILGSVNDRKAAEILSLLPAPRAAAISKSVLANKSTDK